jgi:hypothetical protein
LIHLSTIPECGAVAPLRTRFYGDLAEMIEAALVIESSRLTTATGLAGGKNSTENTSLEFA